MADPIIAPIDDEWQNLSGLGAQITAWEASAGARLPAPYRAFTELAKAFIFTPSTKCTPGTVKKCLMVSSIDRA